MKGLIARTIFLMGLLLAAHSVHAKSPAEGETKITLKTVPKQVLARQEFELVCRISAKTSKVLQVFMDFSGKLGPGHTWKHEGDGVFEKEVKHIERTQGPQEYEVWAKIKKGEEYRFVGESFKINVADKEGDQDLKAFLSWMQKVGYADEIIKVYRTDGVNPVVRELWKKYFNMRKEEPAYRLLKTMPILFIDLMATDEEAINEPLEEYINKLEDYMTRIYGKPFKIEYLKQQVSYKDHFGEPILQKKSKSKAWLKFSPLALNKFARNTAKRITKERQLPANAVIIHWAPKKWKHEGNILKIQDQTGSSPANSGMGFNNFGLGTFAHEWGHGLGLGHMFVVGPGSYSSRTWGLDCIMNHTYVPYSNPKVGRLLSPLVRYALEPENGYLDQKTFAATYSEAMAGTEHLKRRLGDAIKPVTSVSTMTWSTPWNSSSVDSVICKGLKNCNFEIKQLELQPEIEPGEYTLFIDESAVSGPRKTIILKKDGVKIASTYVAWMTKVSHKEHYRLSFKNYLSLVIGKSGERGGSTLAGIGKLLNGKPLIIPDKSPSNAIKHLRVHHSHVGNFLPGISSKLRNSVKLPEAVSMMVSEFHNFAGERVKTCITRSRKDGDWEAIVIDMNGNSDLTDDKAIAVPDSKTKANIVIERNGKSYVFNGKMVHNRFSGCLTLSPMDLLSGTTTLTGDEIEWAACDCNLSGSIDAGDMVYLDRGGNRSESRENLIRLGLEALLIQDGKWYIASGSPDGNIAIGPYKGAMSKWTIDHSGIYRDKDATHTISFRSSENQATLMDARPTSGLAVPSMAWRRIYGEIKTEPKNIAYRIAKLDLTKAAVLKLEKPVAVILLKQKEDKLFVDLKINAPHEVRYVLEPTQPGPLIEVFSTDQTRKRISTGNMEYG